MGIKFSNLATTTLASGVTNSTTTITVADGSVFPALGSGDFFFASIDTPPNSPEVIKVTAISSNTLTVVRGQDGTTATTHASGETIALRVVAAALEDLRDNAGETYTAGSGLTLTGTVFSNSAPDQTVALTGSGGTTVSGTYPNFTISSAASIDGTTINPSSVQIGGTTVIDSSRQIYAKTGTQVGEDGTYSGYGVVGFGGITNGYNRVFGRDDNGDGLFLAAATARGVYVRTNGSSSDTFGFTAAGAFQVNGTTVIDSSRNLTNIGTLNGGTPYTTANDGSGSGLDADLLDGQQGSYYANESARKSVPSSGNYQITNSTTPQTLGAGYLRHDFLNSSGPPGSSYRSVLSISSYTGGSQWTQLSFNYNQGINTPIYFRQNQYNGSTWSSWHQLWDSANDGSGSGLDADLLDGQHGSYYLPTTGGTVNLELASASGTSTGYSDAGLEIREGAKGASASYSAPRIGMHWGNVVASNISMDTGGAITIRNNPGNAYENFRANNIYANGTSLVWHTGNDGSGSGLDADTVDGIQGSSLVRSDASDTMSGTYTFTGGHGAINITSSSILSSASSNWTGDPGGSGKIQYHSNRWYIVGDSSSNRLVQFRRNNSDKSYIDNNGTLVGGGMWSSYNDGSGSGLDADTCDGQHLGTTANPSFNTVQTPGTNADVRFSVWSGTTYGIGMTSGVTLGHLNDFAMTFCMNNDADRGFWWGYSGQGKSAGAMSLTTGGRLWVTYDVTTPTLRLGDGNDGRFFSDTNGRTAFADGDFYIQTSVGNYYNYATNQYMGNTSGNNIYFRSNVMTGTGWEINGVGRLTTRDHRINAGYHLQRLDHHSGHLEGSYNNVGENSTRSNPIYTIGSSYNPASTTLSQMYGIGFTHTNASFIGFAGSAGWGLYVASDGDARVYLSGQSGSGHFTGNITAYASDRRLKTNIQTIDSALEKVTRIRGVEFDWVDDITSEYDFHPQQMHETGVIAQEIQAVIPDAVVEAPMNGNYTAKCGTDHKFLTVDKEKIVPLLIEAIKELKSEVDALKSQLEEKP